MEALRIRHIVAYMDNIELRTGIEADIVQVALVDMVRPGQLVRGYLRMDLEVIDGRIQLVHRRRDRDNFLGMDDQDKECCGDCHLLRHLVIDFSPFVFCVYHLYFSFEYKNTRALFQE